MPLDLTTARVIDFPLRGEWRALNGPAERVPSHGTDYFGQRYAIDFVRADASGTRFQPGSITRQLLAGVPASSFFAWDQPVYNAFAGRVVGTGDGWPDREWVITLWELVRGSLFGSTPATNDYRPLVGNFVLVEGTPGVALYAHLRRGSVRLQKGEFVEAGTLLGTVGNSGNSTMPHLHFHLMDGPDPFVAKGVLAAFRCYERFAHGSWERVECGVPAHTERIRAA